MPDACPPPPVVPSTYMPFLLAQLPDETAYSYIVEVPGQQEQDADWTMYVGEVYRLPLAGTGLFTWKSSDETVAAIDGKGMLAGKGAGNALLTVTIPSGKQAVIKLRVSEM